MRQNRRKSGTAIETQKVLREKWIPLYRMPVELSKEQQEVLVKNGEFDPQEFSEFFKKYSNGTMNPPIIPIGHEGDLR